MKFKNKTLLTIFFSISLYSTSVFAEFNQDVLTIGPLKNKLIIDKITENKMIQTSTGDEVLIENIINQTQNTNVYVIGEFHTNYQCHTFQRDFIQSLVKSNPKLVVGFEFFKREHNEILEQWRLGKIGEEELLKKTGWYKSKSFNYGFTRLIMDVIKENKIKVIGLNLPRDIVHTISRKGFDKLSQKEQDLFPNINISNPEHEYFIKGIFGDMVFQMPTRFKNIYMAQKAWDVIMAESMRETLAKKDYKDYTGIIIAGNNHVVYKLGIPFRYKEAEDNVNITTICPVFISEQKDEETEKFPMMKKMGKPQKPFARFSRGIADYVIAVNQPEKEHYPDIGITVKLDEDKILITRVNEESIGEKNGLSKGDQVISVDDQKITSVEQFYTITAGKNREDSLNINVIKNIICK